MKPSWAGLYEANRSPDVRYPHSASSFMHDVEFDSVVSELESVDHSFTSLLHILYLFTIMAAPMQVDQATPGDSSEYLEEMLVAKARS